MKQYNVYGMSCAACSARVEKAVGALDGVESCSVSLLTNSMGVTGSASPEAVIAAVEGAGYGAELKGAEVKKQDDSLKDRETPVLRRRLIASVGFLTVLMYLSMGHMMWNFPLPEFLSRNHVAQGIIQLILSAIVMVINQKFFVNGAKGLLNRSPNMDTLVAMGSAAAFVYSTAALLMMTDAQLKGDHAAVMDWMHELYFESAAMILALITVGKMLEARSKGRTTNALKSLMDLAPKSARVIRDGAEVEIPAADVRIDDVFAVRPGENIPVDAVVVSGSSAVNEAALTGESIPVDKNVGDNVSAGTLNQSGYLQCRAVRVGEDTALSQIIKMVSDAAATKAPIAKIADKVSGIFVPAVISVALVTIAAWLIAGQTVGFALARGISVLVISCPCALGLATPVAIMVGSGKGAKNGILFKTAESLEVAGKVSIAVLDKTGTITRGEPAVCDVIPYNGETGDSLLRYANSLEIKSEHPLSKAIVKAAKILDIIEVSDFEAHSGKGLSANAENKILAGGNYDFIKGFAEISTDAKKEAEKLAEEGKTPLYFAYGDKFLGIIAVADEIKEESPGAVKELQGMGIKVVMLTGDNERTARAIGKRSGVDEVIAGVLPDGKEKAVRALKKKGKVAMVGDGINDAPALTRADVGIAVGSGTDVAIDAADVVLMSSKLTDVPAAIRLSRRTLRIIHENLFWAFIYNAIGIPLAAGLFIPVLGWEMNPMFGAAAMSLSSFCVVTNALRLNFHKMYDSSRDRKIKPKKEKKKMTKTMKIEGMMCGHCEKRVKKTLEAIEGVESAEVSHEAGTAVVTLASAVSNETLKKAVEDQDYEVLEIK